MLLPVIPSASLETLMSADGFQKSAPASMWNRSPVAGSLSGRGVNCAEAGAASSTSPAARPAQVYGRMVALFMALRCIGRFPPKLFERDGSGPASSYVGPLRQRRYQTHSAG